MVEVALRPALEERAASHGPIEVAVAPAGHRLLEDGSNIELNRGTEVTVQFTAEERRIRLDEGEAHFEVTRDPARPFIVSARGLDVCAVGTAFNVRVDASVVEVLVTHGSVRVESPHSRSATTLVPVLLANQRAVLPLSGEEDPPRIATLTPGEVARVLSWQHRLLDFTATPLSEIVAEFNRRNVLQLVVIDPELAATRITASFRSDNIDGFIRLLEAGFNARAEHRGQSEILLNRN
jgi:transmembrane sensor